MGRRSVGRSRPQRAIYYAIVAKENWRTATRNRAPACPPTPPGAHKIRARADGAAYRGGGERGGAIGNQGCRRASCGFARDECACDARRALGGVRRSCTRWARIRRNEYRKSMLKSRWLVKETAVFIAEEGKRAGTFSIRNSPRRRKIKFGKCERSGPAAIYAVSCSTEARLRHNNVTSQ